MILAMLMLFSAPEDSEQPPASSVEAIPMQPVSNPANWVGTADYPPRALRDGLEGAAGVRVSVGPDGLPRRCEVIASSGHADLDDATCRLMMERARFQIRRDDKGVRIGGSFTTRIRWQIPDDYLEQLARSGFHLDDDRVVWPRAPIADPAMTTLDGADHYPAAALAARQEGDVAMTLAVDAGGKVAGCTVERGSGVASLDEAACTLMRSAGKFEPALDSAGKPVKATVPVVFNWTLPRTAVPEGAKPPPALRKFPITRPGITTLMVDVGADGAARNCTFVAEGGFAQTAGARSLCDSIGGAIRYVPFVDAAGRPVARHVTVRNEITIKGDPSEDGANQ